jgi:5'-3' exonuclease
MIPGYHFNFAKGEMFDIKLPEADIFFFRQVLTGDATDNIPGIRGTGPKTAEKLIPDGCSAEEAYSIIGRAYQSSYKDTASEAVSEIARLLWIRRQKEEVCPHAERLAAACLSG